KWYETQDQIAYYQEFEKEKVVWTPVNSEYSFAIIPSGIYFLNSVFMITGSEIKLFCALFNSTLIRYYLIVLFSSEEEYTYASKQNMEKIPIPRITSFDSPIIKQIEELVDKIILAKKQNLAADTAHWEQEIDNLVYNLYGLTDEDIKIIKNSTKKSD
ncbi:MAG TPA: TaqI-like C-terminal specificity domain-containing protein, partial [Methanofastidiosum sp.]|nr:TaqI-like C-terminal specificity domain-containing protein [Methanofastidiosum sp.]